MVQQPKRSVLERTLTPYKSIIGWFAPEPVEQNRRSEMPNIITADELRTVLGVSESLYSDLYLEQIIDSAELTILPLLTQYQSAITTTRIKDGVAYCTTLRPNYFAVGQSVVVAGCGNIIDGTYDISTHSFNAFEFSFELDEADRVTYAIIPSGTATLEGSSAAELYANVAPVKSAILVVSVEVFQSVTASGNMTTNENFNPQPFILGRSLQSRVVGLLSPFLDVETMAQ
jgi:hypothetical protein